MKTKYQLFVLCLIIGFLSVQAQDILPCKGKRVRISELSILGGVISEFTPRVNEDVPLNILPVSSLLKMDSYVQDNVGFIGRENVSALFGIQFADKHNVEQKYFVLRFGLGYYVGSYMKNNLFVEERNTYDSLVETNETAFLDSVSYRQIDSKYTYDMLRIDGSFLLRTNTPSHWTLFAGLGFTSGVSINANAEVTTHRYLTTEKRYGNQYSVELTNQEISIEKEGRDLGNVFAYSVYVPIGVDFRIGDNHPLWKSSHLFYEFRSGMNYTNRKGMSSKSSIFLHHSFGFKLML